MSEATDELRTVVETLRNLERRADEPEYREPLERLENAALRVGKAWSGSSLGYQACVYYSGLRPPPPGAHFSQDWGFTGMFQGTTGEWEAHDFDELYEEIFQAASVDLTLPYALAVEARRTFDDAKAVVESIFAGWSVDHGDDAIVDRARREIEGIVVPTSTEATKAQVNLQAISRDMAAVEGGFRPAPHQAVIGKIVSCRSPIAACAELATLTQRVANHMDRAVKRQARTEVIEMGSFVFIGHGGSSSWRELKEFIQERLRLHVDEFNRVPVAGVTNVERLVQMLGDAAIAFLVLTAEDERVDGAIVARQNVVHEAGLFQGRLGFTRAIVLLEDDCDEFSNIEGLGQIRFPSGHIAAAFEEVRRVLEREGLV